MSDSSLSFGDVVRLGWLAFRKEVGVFLGVAVIGGVLEWLLGLAVSFSGIGVENGPATDPQLIAEGMQAHPILFATTLLVTALPGTIVALFQTGIAARVALSAVDGGGESWRVLARDGSRIRVIADLLLAGLVVLAGFILCVLPGIVAAVYFTFVPLVSVDGRKNALDESIKAVKEQFGNLAVLWLVSLAAGVVALAPATLFPRFGFLFATAAAFGIGGVFLCCLAVLYRASRGGRRLVGAASSVPPRA